MTIPAERLQTLLTQINDGRAAEALLELDQFLKQQPGHLAALTLRAEALRAMGHLPEATEAFKQAA